MLWNGSVDGFNMLPAAFLESRREPAVPTEMVEINFLRLMLSFFIAIDRNDIVLIY
jgi:hypothetical protein